MQKSKLLTAVSVVAIVMLPILAFSMESMRLHSGTYLEMHWADFIVLFFVLVSAGYALLGAKIYGGIVGTSLKLITSGLVAIVFTRLVETFGHLGVVVMSPAVSSIIDVIGFALIALGMFKLYSDTKKRVSGVI